MVTRRLIHKRAMLQDPYFPDCPVRNIIARVADEPMRFSELLRALPDISQKMLTSTLRHLEADGFLVRKVYAEVPPRTTYTLTPRAHSFMTACRPMVDWGIDNYAAIMKDRARAEK